MLLNLVSLYYCILFEISVTLFVANQKTCMFRTNFGRYSKSITDNRLFSRFMHRSYISLSPEVTKGRVNVEQG